MAEQQKPTYEISTRVIVKGDFVAFHRWLNAPESSAYLRNYHRHTFTYTVCVPVNGPDREIEFYELAANLRKYVRETFEDQYMDESCEAMAFLIAHYTLGAYPAVSNAAVIVGEEYYAAAEVTLTRPSNARLVMNAVSDTLEAA